MSDLLGKRIQNLLDNNAAATLAGIQRGIEKESLRITPQGKLAQTPHPAALGSTLTHPYITTDYSEALLEFITPPSPDLKAPLDFLEKLHRFTYQNIGDEILWVNSMPCVMGEDSDIPIAEYGHSNVGRMKHIYRIGLGHRYGRTMQTIAGIHYNFSFPEPFWKLYQLMEQDTQPLQDFISKHYFGLTRNFQRYSWLLIYLFGASPAICASFLRGKSHQLDEKANHTLFRPWATSLRMSDLGYQNNAQSDLHISYNNLDEYVETLTHAIKTPEPAYEKIGLKKNGEYAQLNTNILQIENEYYSSIRPKRTALSGERPTVALQKRGVEYIEIRALDLNPFEPVGIHQEQVRFLDLFATYCLLQDSPLLDENTLAASKENIRQVVYQGRQTGIPLTHQDKRIAMKDWALQNLEQMQPIAELFDNYYGCEQYRQALKQQEDKLRYPDCTPSARILEEMESRNLSFFHFAMEQAQHHRDYFLSAPLDTATNNQLTTLAAQSLEQQASKERESDISFEQYLADYFAD